MLTKVNALRPLQSTSELGKPYYPELGGDDMHDGARLAASLASRAGDFCWPRACSISSSSQSPSARGRRRTPASAPKPHSCRAFSGGADKPPPLMLHLRLVWFRVSFSRGGADDGAPCPCEPPAPAVWTTSPPHHALAGMGGTTAAGLAGAGVPRDAALYA